VPRLVQNPFLIRRKDLDLSQEEAAQKCGLSLSSWRNYETGRNAPVRGKFHAIAEGLNWTLDDVIDAVAWIQRQLAHAA